MKTDAHTIALDLPLGDAPTVAVLSHSAVLSPCRRYRYELWRRWNAGPYCMFVGLNPSTADETTDDATIRKCVKYAKTWGYSALCMTNLFAWRETSPKEMKKVSEPVGPENDATLVRLASGAGIVVAAWGADGGHMGRDVAVLALLPAMQCLHRTKSGAPGHPLYLLDSAQPYPLTRAA